MNSNKLVIPSLAEDENGNLQIHIPRNDFGEFIQGLLAQPRTLRKTWKKYFNIDHDFIRHLNEVVKQRVHSQQISNVISFQSSIYFLDGRIQTVTSWDAFDKFRDNSDSIATKLDIIWGYLVKFPAKPIPEKQTTPIRLTHTPARCRV